MRQRKVILFHQRRAACFCCNMSRRPFLASLFVLSAVSIHAGDFAARFDELKARATPLQLYSLLYDLPKGGDLHNHSGGSEIAEWRYAVMTDPKRNGGDVFYTRARFKSPADAINPAQRFHVLRRYTYEKLTPEQKAEYVRLDQLTAEERSAWCDSMRLESAGEGREEFFAVIWPRLGQSFQNLSVSTELLVENMKAFGAEHVAYLETQFGVNGATDNEGRPIPTEEAVAFVKQRLSQPDVIATGVTVRFQRTVLRFLPNAEASLTDIYGFVDAHRDMWVGLNMAGIEENGFGYPARFLETYRKLRSHYPTLALSIHAGEMDGNDSHIRDTLLLGATRIGHGVNLLKDPDTLLLLQHSNRTLVEVNLISNRLLEYTPDLSAHPFPEFLRTGVPVCLNTDDRGMWDSNMTDEYYTAVTNYHLSWDEIVTLGRNSLAHSFVQSDVKAKLIAEYDKRVAAFAAKYGAGNVDESLKALAAVKPTTYGYAKRNWAFDFSGASN
jgi:adenosine deaminase CECR1